jgi:hypothetical protein
MTRAHRRPQLRQFASLDPMHVARLLRKVKFRIVVGEQLGIHLLNEIQGRQFGMRLSPILFGSLKSLVLCVTNARCFRLLWLPPNSSA